MSLKLSSPFHQELQGFVESGSKKFLPADTPLKKISLIAWNALIEKMNFHIHGAGLSNWNRTNDEIEAHMQEAANKVRVEMQILLNIIDEVL